MAFFFFFFEKSGLIADTETFCFFLTTIFCSLNNPFSFTLGARMTFELRLLPAKLLYIFATIITHAVENKKKDILFPTLWLFTYSSGRQENLRSSHILLLLALGISLTQPGPRILHPQSAGLGSCILSGGRGPWSVGAFSWWSGTCLSSAEPCRILLFIAGWFW